MFGGERQAGGGQAQFRAEAQLRLLPVAFGDALEPPRSDRVLTLVFGGGVRLEVPPGFDGATLARLVDVLAQRTAA